ncbi:MFS transporter [Jeotgalibacillus proteolyticus]|uniref:MFS transporter n=1 Tax=Jeotgalibacillus proteolyticus TaxID=2082395 RepID=A0A2S5GBP2_9BACL|nr:MFS transporter [Jeotgalibacillus proteolyticus]PPA70416.1 MFS transporter [Jeotgalibacillus proteolyticus]
MRSLLQDGRFRLILLGNIASSVGAGITMIAIPWLLVSGENGSIIFGYVTMGMTVINFLLAPLVGQLIDRVSRKQLLLTSKKVSLLVVLGFSIYGMAGMTFETWHYMVLFVTGSLYYTIFYPTMFALNQELFSKDQYKSLNGTIEIQGQLSSVIAGGAASILLMVVELQTILLVNAAAYGIAIWLYIRIPYLKKKTEVSGVKLKSAKPMSFIKHNRAIFLLFLFSTMPFIGVMLTNYLFPVYLVDVLQTSGSVYGFKEMIYAIGAVAAGILAPIAAAKWGEGKTILFTMSLYTAAIFIVLVANVPVFLMLMFFLAIGNSGARVARNALMMEKVPNEMIGRIDGLIRSIGLFVRILLLGVFTGMVSGGAIMMCFMILGLLVFASLIIVLFASRAARFEGKVVPEETVA